MKNGTDIPPGVDTILAGVLGHDGAATYKIRAKLCGNVGTLHDAYAYYDLGACNRNEMSYFQYDLATHDLSILLYFPFTESNTDLGGNPRYCTKLLSNPSVFLHTNIKYINTNNLV